MEIGIVFVAMKRNIKELPAVIEIAKKIGAGRILVKNVLPYTKEMINESLFYSSINREMGIRKCYGPKSLYPLEYAGTSSVSEPCYGF